MNELQNLLASGNPLFITVDGFRQAMLAAFPLNGKIESNSDVKAAYGFSPAEVAAYLKDHTWYQFECHVALQELRKVLAQDDGTSTVTLTESAPFSFRGAATAFVELPELEGSDVF